ncbi:MerR family transcriptional regulator [Shumkonia mesophila]|uniref:MerR family transcriptional regulator n=1 Tax=Shumkonia mesophila TaxID=2838854 RepID=UPI0029351BD6|nr:MerR family transcriptional regulator [Shumkonia mesophila]
MAQAAGQNTELRRRGKSEGAFRTISEVAVDLDLPQHVLRFWESKFIQIRPLKRGGGRRYYRPEDVALLRRIRQLLYVDGYTIRGVQKLLKHNGGKSLDGDELPAPFPAVALAPVADEPADVPVVPAAVPAAGGDDIGPRRRAELQALLRELESLREHLRTVLK